uniref:EB domain-containing protein n=1 Tax=Trichuris muris TaxID=70415 RepID=A0A5S6QJY3_TRIMR
MPCQPGVDQVRMATSENERYLKCEPRVRVSGNKTQITGEWKEYDCKDQKTMDCLRLFNNATRLDSPQDDFGVDYDTMEGYSDKKVGPSYIIPYPSDHRESTGCKASGPSVPGGHCCLDSFTKLEPDSKYPQYYLQCTPTAKNPTTGQWVRMQCPEELVFDPINQICISSEPANQQSTAHGGRKNFRQYNNPFSTINQAYSSHSYPMLCPDGSAARGPCFSDRCPSGLRCVSGVCCPAPKLVCEDGSPAINTCQRDEECSTGQYCSQDKGICCKRRAPLNNPRSFTYALSSACPAALTSVITLCNSAYQCPSGSICIISLGICCPMEQLPSAPGMCPHGSWPLKGSWCMTSNQCPSAYYCPISTRACCPLPTSPAVSTRSCPDGSPATSISCSMDSQCPNGYYCPTSVGFCCRIGPGSVQTTDICPDGSEPVGYCSGGACGTGFECIKDMNICCPKSAIFPLTGECSDGSKAVSYCLNGQCPYGYFCQGGVCCRSIQGLLCPDGSSPAGSCLNGRCGFGFACTANKICCPQAGGGLWRFCPYGGRAAGYCIDGRCPGNMICTSQNLCCPLGLRTCPDGSAPTKHCINGQCGLGFYCVNNVCCPTGFVEPPKLCLNGLQPQGHCTKGQCGPGFTCTPENVCCPVSIIPGLCPDGKQPAGACINGLCGTGFTCLAGANICCTGSTQPTYCLDGSVPIGPCTAGLCGVGYICTTGNLCCPQASSSAGRCADGSVSAGPCLGGLCAVGYYCAADNVCCQEDGSPPVTDICPDGSLPTESCTADFQCSRPSLICIDGYNCCPLTGYQEIGMCPQGTVHYGPCVNGLCPENMHCNAGQCCGPPSSSKAFLTADAGLAVPTKYAATQSKAPGSKCSSNEECSGSKSRLASCHKHTCTCLPPAKPMKGTCVLRPVQKSAGEYSDLVMHDTPMVNSVSPKRNCTNSTQCRVTSHEKCISGACVSPRAPGEPCSDDNECKLNCAASSCQERSGRKICTCKGNLYRYKRQCMKKCPSGTLSHSDMHHCEDTAFSIMVQDDASFGSDIQANSAC